jgi:hypothetical protein
MPYLSAGLFFAVTGGHFLLTPYWLKRVWGHLFSTPEELSFYSVVVGFGVLQAVLHGLACTVGISLPAGLAALIALHLCILAGVSRWYGAAASAIPATPKVNNDPAPHARKRAPGRRATQVTTPTSLPTWERLTRIPLLTLVGLTGIGTCVFSWLMRSVQSRQITGIDANQYHVPYAVNFARGASPFGYLVLAVDHNSPVGASILNAWLYHAFAGPLCFDLVNLLPFLLLLVSLVYLFTLLTGERGWEWAPVVFLLLFTGKLFRISLYISADLFYAATFAAVFTQLCALWVRNKADSHDWLALSLAVGMLVSSKTQGPVSALLLLTCAGVAVLLRSVVWPKHPPRLAGSLSMAGLCAILLIASGGIWPIRNWLYFGSPFAPAGLHLFGVTIFKGSFGYTGLAGSDVGETGSGTGPTAKFLSDFVRYILPRDFLARSREWVGTWPAYLSIALVMLLVDAGYQFARQRHVTDLMRRKLFAVLFFGVLFVAHSHLLIRARGTNVLDPTLGPMLRYLIPLYALYPLVAYTGLFTNMVPWLTSRPVKWLVILPGLAYVLSQYNGLTQLPAEWVRAHGPEDLVDYRLMPLAALAVAPWCIPLPGAWKRYARYGSAVIVGLAFVAFVRFAVAQDATLVGAWSAHQRQQLLAFQRTGTVPSPFTGVFLRALADQRQRSASCERSRFFMMSPFFYPLELQDASYNNLVFLLPSDATRWAQKWPGNQPGGSGCDYVVAVHTEVTTYGDHYPAVSTEEIRRWLPAGAQIEEIGDSGRYRVYHVLPQ